MELIAADKDTVTIKMNWKEEFNAIVAVFMSVNQEYEKLDEQIHNLSKDQIKRLKNAMTEIGKKFPLKGR
ncbi:MAG: hypothetical protein IPP67_04615 [Rhodospirillaceae bacterium]|nr:hypothetical protein [Rhodospirillaceae bacterium]